MTAVAIVSSCCCDCGKIKAVKPLGKAEDFGRIDSTLQALDIYNLLRMSSSLYDNIGGIGSVATLHPTKEGLSLGFQKK